MKLSRYCIQTSKPIAASGEKSKQTRVSADYADRYISEAENSTEHGNRAAFDTRGSDRGAVERAIKHVYMRFCVSMLTYVSQSMYAFGPHQMHVCIALQYVYYQIHVITKSHTPCQMWRINHKEIKRERGNPPHRVKRQSRRTTLHSSQKRPCHCV